MSDDTEPRASEVDHPSHYAGGDTKCSKCGRPIECIDVIEHMTFSIGNAVKYLWRAGRKAKVPTKQDYEKAIWYIRREIERLEKAGG